MDTVTRAAVYGAYHRVSDANGRELDAETTITHREAFDQIDAWARSRKGVTIAEHRYLDWDQSGSRMERPELDRMLADLEAGRIDGVVVAQVDRLSRAEVGDALATVKRIAGDDVARPRPLVLLDLGIDPSTEFGEFGLTILLALARMQWRRYKRQYAQAQRRAAGRGVWIGPAPLGYRKSEHGGLEPDGKRARIMREAFRVAASARDGDGTRAADAYLHAELGRRRHVGNTRAVLANRAYLGEHHLAGGEPHEALTTPALFEAAQSTPQSRRASGDYPLTHVATCEACGAGLIGGLQTARERTYRRMRCSASCAGGVGSVSADGLEREVRDALRVALADKAFRLSYDAGDVDGAEQALEVAESRLTRYLEDTETRDEVGEDAWRAGRRAHVAAVAGARGELAAVAAQSARSTRLPGPEQLDDPVHFERALAVIGRLEVAGGRRPIGERVALTWAGVDDLDDGVGVLAA
jgi:DNA invertase Pin-like site-specific DNA recombinase